MTVFGNVVYSMKVIEARNNMLNKEECWSASTSASPAWRKDIKFCKLEGTSGKSGTHRKSKNPSKGA